MILRHTSKWFPWRLFTKYVAQAKGFVDPVSIYAQLQRFSQPSEVGEPIELLRAGLVFHARGLLNSKVLQHNLDWVWPYWVERQFDPADTAFLPRAFSITHVNLTNRNWTAIGYPGVSETPIVDPRGLLTPFWDSWSIDAWGVNRVTGTDDPDVLLPSRAENTQQYQNANPILSVETRSHTGSVKIQSESSVVKRNNEYVCRSVYKMRSRNGGWLAIAARPCNPEGVSFIHDINLSKDRLSWLINGDQTVRFSRPVDKNIGSDYVRGDVHIHLTDSQDESHVSCHVGMATAAALFNVQANEQIEITIEIPLESNAEKVTNDDVSTEAAWSDARRQSCLLQVNDEKIARLFNAARDTLILMSPDEVFAGPYTYKRYWYRDTVFIAHGLLSAGLVDRVEDIVKRFPKRQDRNGYFHSQEGEWDSNGQVLWLVNRFVELGGQLPDDDYQKVIVKGADWIIKKRRNARHGPQWDGLLPAGFSAEHLGPNDHYYWDNYWSIAGLEAAAKLMSSFGDKKRENRYIQEAVEYSDIVNRSIENAQSQLPYPAIPAARTRRLDAGVIGSIVASYPLHLVEPDDEKLQGSIKYLFEQCFYAGGFFQDMIHSGVNAYLTLHIAQVLLRMGDKRYIKLIESIAGYASSAGHWPEAVHPHTRGGCMGDGHHAWAAAEWLAIIRNCFVREEGGVLILGSGVPENWYNEHKRASLSSVPTQFGIVSVEIEQQADTCRLAWHANWQSPPSQVIVDIPGFEKEVFSSIENHTSSWLNKL